MAVDPGTFKNVLSLWPSGVTVITVPAEGGLVGITASSFNSVSVDPPLISVCVAQKLYTHNAIHEAGRFAVNILNREQVELGKRFAGMIPGLEDRFEGLGTTTAVTGAPLLADVVGWLDCTLAHAFEAGDHTIFVGHVEAAGMPGVLPPLLYHNRSWGKLAEDLPDRIELIEVGLRDGLQNEAVTVSTEDKVRLVEKLISAGVRHIQVASFVHPKRVPQMADAEAVIEQLPEHSGVDYTGLALNLKGVERAHAAGLTHVDAGISASDELSQRNTGMTLVEARAAFAEMVRFAQDNGMKVRGGVQCAFGFQQPDDVPMGTVLHLVEEHLSLGIDSLSIADSSGLADPVAIHRLLQQVVPMAGDTPIVLHLHDTRGMGLANVLAALKTGISRFDASFGGLGGCPFIPGALGNIATEDTAYMAAQMGIETGVDIAALSAIAREVAGLVGHDLPGRIHTLHGESQPA